MFALTRPHRHLFATVALLAFTVAPTGYVAWTAWRINHPSHVATVANELSRRLGLFVGLDAVRYPKPGLIVYQGVVLRLEEPGRKESRREEIARAEMISLRREGRDLTLEADGLRLRGPSPRAAMSQVVSLLQRAGGVREFDRISLSARSGEVDLGSPGLKIALRDLAATFQADRLTPSLTASYKVVGPDGVGPRCELALGRDRGVDPARTTLTFRTGDGQPVPASVLDPFFVAGDWFGPSAKVDGELTLSQAGAGDWQAEFKGSILDVDLGTLVGRLAPEHRVSGRARLRIERARTADRRGRGLVWVDARGELVSTTQGTIGMGLVRALERQMHFRVNDRLDSRRNEQDYQALGLGFAMDERGDIRWTGALGDAYLPGAVIVQGQAGKPLLRAPEGTATVASLIRSLCPDTTARADLMIPGTDESEFLQRHLPVPAARVPGTATLKAN